MKETPTPIPGVPGRLQRYDYELERAGLANAFMFCEPLKGKRCVAVRERKTAIDWANEIKHLVDHDYPDAEKIVRVIDHLNTQKIASLYSAFPPEQANRLAKKLEIHYTPKQGSWLNIAEIELAAMTKQCLSRRIPAPQTLKAEIDAGCRQAHDSERQVDWQFSSAKARIKLKRLYPQNSGRLSTRTSSNSSKLRSSLIV